MPTNQSLPAACPVCGVILAKVALAQRDADGMPAQALPHSNHGSLVDERDADEKTPAPLDPLALWARVALLAGFGVWGLMLISKDYRTGEIGASFIHLPLLIFHEAGHVVFRVFGHWMMVLGGSLGQLIMPAILCGALLVKNRDPYGASMGLWFLGVSLLDLAPYMFDALHPQLMLLSGMTGEEGGHDWIFLFTSLGLLPKSQFIGGVVHKLGALVVLAALAWGAVVLRMQSAQERD